MAKTYGYAIAGGLIATFTISPALSALLLPDSVAETETLLVRSLRRVYEPVAEFALGLTICGLRRIPQTHHAILTSQADWNYEPPGGIGRPGERGSCGGRCDRFFDSSEIRAISREMPTIPATMIRMMF